MTEGRLKRRSYCTRRALQIGATSNWFRSAHKRAKRADGKVAGDRSRDGAVPHRTSTRQKRTLIAERPLKLKIGQAD